MSERCKPYEGCMGTGVLDDLSDSGSGRTVYCDCVAGIALQIKEMGFAESVPDRSERLAARHTRYDGSPR